MIYLLRIEREKGREREGQSGKKRQAWRKIKEETRKETDRQRET